MCRAAGLIQSLNYCFAKQRQSNVQRSVKLECLNKQILFENIEMTHQSAFVSKAIQFWRLSFKNNLITLPLVNHLYFNNNSSTLNGYVTYFYSRLVSQKLLNLATLKWVLVTFHHDVINKRQTFQGICPPPGTCKNTHGSFKCVCPRGYKLDASGTFCVDRDECEDNSDKCGGAECRNVHGSYK